MWQMSKGWAFELTNYLLIEAVGEEAARELFPVYEEDMPLHLPEGIEKVHLSFKPPPSISKTKDQLPEVADIGGSNSWAISGEKSESGYPILENDPHLPSRAPGVWYAVRLVAEKGKI